MSASTRSTPRPSGTKKSSPRRKSWSVRDAAGRFAEASVDAGRSTVRAARRASGRASNSRAGKAVRRASGKVAGAVVSHKKKLAVAAALAVVTHYGLMKPAMATQNLKSYAGFATNDEARKALKTQVVKLGNKDGRGEVLGLLKTDLGAAGAAVKRWSGQAGGAAKRWSGKAGAVAYAPVRWGKGAASYFGKKK